MNSSALLCSIAMLALITLPNNCLFCIALYSFVHCLYPKTKCRQSFYLHYTYLLISLSFIMVTFAIFSYLENVRYKSLCIRDKGRLETTLCFCLRPVHRSCLLMRWPSRLKWSFPSTPSLVWALQVQAGEAAKLHAPLGFLVQFYVFKQGVFLFLRIVEIKIFWRLNFTGRFLSYMIPSYVGACCLRRWEDGRSKFNWEIILGYIFSF